MRQPQALQVYKRFGSAVAMLVAGIYVAMNLQGPDGIPALLAKWEELRVLELQNAELSKELADKRELVRHLENSREQRELVIREKLHKLLPGEKMYQVPDPPETSNP